jgi:hypothetical protein
MNAELAEPGCHAQWEIQCSKVAQIVVMITTSTDKQFLLCTVLNVKMVTPASISEMESRDVSDTTCTGIVAHKPL